MISFSLSTISFKKNKGQIRVNISGKHALSDLHAHPFIQRMHIIEHTVQLLSHIGLKGEMLI